MNKKKSGTKTGKEKRKKRQVEEKGHDDRALTTLNIEEKCMDHHQRIHSHPSNDIICKSPSWTYVIG